MNYVASSSNLVFANLGTDAAMLMWKKDVQKLTVKLKIVGKDILDLVNTSCFIKVVSLETIVVSSTENLKFPL